MSIITMAELTSGMCRWPFGNPEDKGFHFCGEQCDPSLPYCEMHMGKAQATARKPKA
jgi:GcrA cell cycle regulator